LERKYALLINYWIRALAVVRQVELLAAQGVVVRVELLEGGVAAAAEDVEAEADVEVEVAEAEAVESGKPVADKMI
jgi:hypothetical protein